MSDQVFFRPIGQLAAALAAAQGEITPALKTSTNPHFKNKFADLTEVWDACRAALSKNKIAVMQCPQFDSNGAWLETTLAHESGEWIMSRFPLLNNKGDMQGFGSSITYAKRYSLSAMVGVTSEDDDGNAASVPALTRAPITAATSPGFDPTNKLHTDKLAAECMKRKIFGDHQKNLFAAMKGKSFTELETLIKATNPESAGE
jgi:ERF superfamily